MTHEQARQLKSLVAEYAMLLAVVTDYWESDAEKLSANEKSDEVWKQISSMIDQLTDK